MPGSTMGETTRESLASVIRGANAYGGGFDAGQPMTRPPSGGGGLGGSFGKAPTGRGLFNPAPPAAAAPPPSDYVSTGRRARVAPASLGARNLWDAGTVNDPPVYSPAKDPSPRPVPAARVVSRKKADSTSGAAAAAPAAGPPSLARRTLSARSGNASAGAQASLLRSQAAQAKKQVSNLSAVKEEASPVKAAPPSKVCVRHARDAGAGAVARRCGNSPVSVMPRWRGSRPWVAKHPSRARPPSLLPRPPPSLLPRGPRPKWKPQPQRGSPS